MDVVVWHGPVVTGEREAGGARLVADVVWYVEGEELLQGRYLFLIGPAVGPSATPVDRPVHDPLAVRAEVGGGVEALGKGNGYVDVASCCTRAWRGRAVPAVRQFLGPGQGACRAGHVDLGGLRIVCGMSPVPCDELEALRRNPHPGRIEPPSEE